jgi:4-hydroxy-tetrahydrodipicolinate reductase
MADVTRVAIVGASGRMGRALLEDAEGAGCEVVAAIVRPGSPSLGEALGPGGVRATDDLAEAASRCDVVIDFSSPAACVVAARAAAAAGVAFVSGTTGLGAEELAALEQAAGEAAVLHAANFSVGVNVLARLVELAARATGEEWDLEVFEAHHKHKVDAPSGTALLLGRAAAAGRGVDLDAVADWARHGATGPREQGAIGFQVMRGGDIVGEHTVFACGEGERIELGHRATDRGIFARGALRAARWIAARGPGAYSMDDVLFGSGS